MGVLVLVSGASGSGKSAFADRLAGQTNREKFYIATMIPCTEDNFWRIEKHRHRRNKYGFCTLELPYNVGDAPVASDSVVLLEDVSNLLANNIFEKGGNADGVFEDIKNLLKRCRTLVAVTISDVSCEGCNSETSEYINSLNEINQELFDLADIAITMQDNTPVYQKGEPNEFI